MADYNQYGGDQGGWEAEQYSDDIPHTAYPIDQSTLDLSFSSGVGPHEYTPAGSTRQGNTGSSGSYIPPSTLAAQPWGYQSLPGAWTGSATMVSNYAVASENRLDNHLDNNIINNPFLDATAAADFPDVSNLGDNLPAPDQPPQDYNEYDHQQPPIPRPSTSPGQVGCDVCEETFANQKNWDRHLRSEKHIRNVQYYVDVPKYKCACNFHQARKDNYIRHLKGCAFRIDFVYVCICGEPTQDKAHHEQHINLCGRKRRGKGQM
ncbi:hypothetical protein QBC40DRAFT_252643 [Triangularia verruculosa]|uniref:C2H2-type domain-containing protein n=1 Tax=Triangularia verruculosa TaxID=2587418 RepID=A0AAN6XJN1_9PEZI|nr:hypothetical protein QBC40DRAFT_252643 [Triangularia verruculosa]